MATAGGEAERHLGRGRQLVGEQGGLGGEDVGLRPLGQATRRLQPYCLGRRRRRRGAGHRSGRARRGAGGTARHEKRRNVEGLAGFFAAAATVRAAATVCKEVLGMASVVCVSPRPRRSAAGGCEEMRRSRAQHRRRAGSTRRSRRRAGRWAWFVLRRGRLQSSQGLGSGASARAPGPAGASRARAAGRPDRWPVVTRTRARTRCARGGVCSLAYVRVMCLLSTCVSPCPLLMGCCSSLDVWGKDWPATPCCALASLGAYTHINISAYIDLQMYRHMCI